MFEVMGGTICVSRGDTGLIRFQADDGITLGEADRGVFTIRRRRGALMLEKVIVPEGNEFLVPFANEETEIPAGDYEWDIRVVLDAQLDEAGRVTGGREVITPFLPGRFRVVKAVGSV